MSNQISVELRPPKDIAIDLHVKALVGYRASAHFHVFELSRHLPRFAMYGFVRSVSKADNNNSGGGGGETAGAHRPVPAARSRASRKESTNGESVADRMNNLDNSNNGNGGNRQEWDHIYTSLSNTISNENFNAEVRPPKSFVAVRIADSLGKVVSGAMEKCC